MSSPVKTAVMPSRAAAAEVSIEVILALASGERTNDAQSMPNRLMSST